MIINIGYTTIQRDARVWSTGDVIVNSTTNQMERYNGSIWVAVTSPSMPNAVIRSIQNPSTRRTVGAPSGYYPDYAATSQLDYIGIDCPDVALKGNATYIDTWTKLIAPPISIAATSVLSTGFTANWSLDTYWNGAGYVNEVFTSYELTISTSSTFASGNSVIPNLLTTSYTFTGLTAATNYYYRLRLTNGTDTSAYSSTIIQATAAAPTQNEWLDSYSNNLFKSLGGNVTKQAFVTPSININAVDFWAVANIPSGTPNANAHIFNLSDSGVRKFFFRNSGTSQAGVGQTNDAAAQDATVGTPTNVMNQAGRLLLVKSGTTITVYKDNLSTVIATLNITTATGVTTVTRINVGQDHTGANQWNYILEKFAIYSGTLPATANLMLAAV